MDNDSTPVSPAQKTYEVIADTDAISARIIDDLDAIRQIMLTGWMEPPK